MRQLTPDQTRCLHDIAEFGDQSIGYYHLQDGLDHHFRPRGFASSYTDRGACGMFGLAPLTYVLGNPVTPKEDYEDALGTFVEEHKGCATFIQIDEHAGAILERLGYHVNIMGKDLWLDVANFRPKGNDFI